MDWVTNSYAIERTRLFVFLITQDLDPDGIRFEIFERCAAN